MADYGAFFRADDGTLLVTSDSPCYEFVGEVAPSSRSGNVNTYSVSTAVTPLIFVKCGSGNAGGVLALTGSAYSWTVSVLSTVSCNIEVFVPITGVSTSGIGMAVYKSDGTPVFDSSKKLLNARAISDLSEGASFTSASGTDMVAYVSGPVKPTSSVSEQWVNVESWGYVDTQYVCRYSLQYVCTTTSQYVCTTQYVCTPSFSCGFDPITGGFACGYVDSCSYQQVCSFQDVQSCSYQNVQTCGFEQIFNYAQIDALVRTTTWAVDRGAARIASTTISFDWIRHQSGFYKEVVRYNTFGFSQNLNGAFLPPGYIPPIYFIDANSAYEGALTKDNRYPYTTDRANTGALACITAIRSDYD